MELEFKRDFEQAQAQWEGFWRGENRRPMVSAVIPKPGVEPVDKPEYTAGRDGNYGPVVDQLLRYGETHEFIGEAIPFFYLEFAADHFAGLLGAKLHFREDGHGYGWAEPFVRDWDEQELRFQPNGEWWQRTVEFAQALRAGCDGKLMIAAPTLVASLDALSAIRGAQNLLMDLVTQPDKVHRALAQVTRAHGEILDALSELLDFPTYGSINRHGMYTKGRIAIPQCDFSCMISPAMYREFEVPYLRQEMARLDAAEYHLDGPGAIKHLPALCEIEELDIVQWVPGSGFGEAQDWTWLYDRIDQLGKGQIRGADADGAVELWRRYQSKKLVLGVRVASRAEAEALMARLVAVGK